MAGRKKTKGGKLARPNLAALLPLLAAAQGAGGAPQGILPGEGASFPPNPGTANQMVQISKRLGQKQLARQLLSGGMVAPPGGTF